VKVALNELPRSGKDKSAPSTTSGKVDRIPWKPDHIPRRSICPRDSDKSGLCPQKKHARRCLLMPDLRPTPSPLRALGRCAADAGRQSDRLRPNALASIGDDFKQCATTMATLLRTDPPFPFIISTRMTGLVPRIHSATRYPIQPSR
jgi:hypothetical protein